MSFLKAIVSCIGASLFFFGVEHSQAHFSDEDSTSAWRIGAGGGSWLFSHSADFRGLPTVPTCCPGFGNTSSSALGGWLFGEYLFSPSLAFQFRASYFAGSVTFEADERIGSALLNGQPVDAISRHFLENRLSSLEIAPLVAYRPLDNIPVEIFGGVSVVVPMSSTFSQREQLLAPFGATFSDGQLTRNVIEGDIPAVIAPQIAGIVGLRALLSIGSTFSLAPEVAYSPALSGIVDNVEWRRSSVRVGLSLIYTLPSGTSEPVLIPPVDTTQYTPEKGITAQEETKEPLPSEQRRGSASVEQLTFKNADGENLPVLALRQEVIENRRFPLLPYIFFPQGSAILAETRQNLFSSPLQTTNFTESEITELSLEAHKNILNVIGKRLSASPSSRLTVVGSVNNIGEEKDNRSLGFARARAVKEYLIKVWNVPSEQVETIATLLPRRPSNNDRPEGQEENRRVELSSDDPAILRDIVFTEQKQASATVPLRIELPASFIGEQYALRVRAGQQTLLDSVFTAAQTQLSFSVPTNFEGRVISAELRDIEAELMASGQIDVERKQSFATLPDNQAFLLFDYGSTALSSQLNATLAEFVNRLAPNMQIRVEGFTDITGDDSFNRKLSEQRCEAVVQSLRKLGVPESRITITPIGGISPLYDNSLPEGRFYSRNVTLSVLQR